MESTQVREVDELTTVVKALQDGTTSSMVERMVGMGERLLEAADLVARPGMLELLQQLPSTAKILVHAQESLNNLLGKARELDEMMTMLKALQDGTTSSMVERMVGMGERLLEAADLMARPGMLELLRETAHSAPALAQTLQTVRMLQETGTLDALGQFGLLAGALKNSVTDSMATRVAGLAASSLELADQAVQAGAGDLLIALSRASADARAEAEKDERPITLWGLKGQLRDPQVQKGVKLLLALTKRLPEIVEVS